MVDLICAFECLQARATRLKIIQEQNLEARKRRLEERQRKEEQLQAKPASK